ncbi:MAG: FAD:protein FMN transferase [Flavobacteriales bacterium]|nr:FAD:protein FMN transferase [Flavobacteriales bacterium]
MKKIFAFLSISAFIACSPTADKSIADEFVTISGETQGTTFTVTYRDTVDYSLALDSIFKRVDGDLSLWVEGSLINRMNDHNRTDTVFAFIDSTRYFSILFDVSYELFKKTNGAFDPTVRPLVEYWGFGLKNMENATPAGVDSILPFVGMIPANFDMIEVYVNTYTYEETQIRKGDPRVKVDFNAIAQGFTVDLVSDYLHRKGIDDYMVEIGGELICKGVNTDSIPWRIAVDKPIESNEHIAQGVLKVFNMALATSGNYRKFYEKDGKKLAHTIDPRTGYPVDHSLLSVTVMATNAMMADAYATAFMVMGLDETIAFLDENPLLNMHAMLIYDDNGTTKVWMSEALKTVYEDVSHEPS